MAIPTRDLLVIHPDLDYAEALGAVAGTLPHLHCDVVKSLVDQVTPRPNNRATLAVRRMVAASLVAVLALGVVGFTNETAVAEARFGQAWQQEMAQLGMTCQQVGRISTRMCVGADDQVMEVRGFARRDSSLYMMCREDGSKTYMQVFESRKDARQWSTRNPSVTVTGRIAVWS